ncbi:hypothetical protein C1646_758637 [Rhizophagus diaphanus]|nr:hypothetical protein C1646_758637 [Rhizophagus diaphanus] [Rhizophagus sp. MUCL 43196]
MGIQLPKISRSSLTRRTQRSMKLVRIFEKIGMDKIKYLSEYSPNSISELANDQIQEIIEAQKERDNSAKQDDFPTPEISADEEEYIKMLTGGIDDETLYGSDDEGDHDSAPNPVEETNGDSDCSHDNDSEEEMPDESDNDGYDRYGGYNEYGECDRGYYYRDGRYERKTSPMMSPIISPVTA